MSTAAIFNKLGKTVMPKVFDKAFPDTLTVQGETVSAGTGGGRIKSATTSAYTSVPCAYEPTMQHQSRDAKSGKTISIQRYLVTMPTHTSAGTRINLDPKAHRLIVAARGTEPAKTFRIISIRDLSGVAFEAVCEREN